MILVTLEGLGKSCDELLKKVHCILKSHMLPWPMPVATSVQSTADEMSTCLAGALARLRCLSRMQDTCDIVCGAHWISTPLVMDPGGRAVFHRVMLEVSAAVADVLGVRVDHHIVVVVHASEHEAFEQLIDSMESRDVLLSDFEQMADFLRDVEAGAIPASIFPHDLRTVHAPPRLNDNNVDVAFTSKHIASVVNGLSSARA